MIYIYLHGFCSGPGSHKASYFRRRFRELGIDLLIPDLNGIDFTHLTISSQILIVRELMSRFDEDVVLIGSSMGGYLAALIAEDEKRVKRLVMMAPAFRFIARQKKLLGEEGIRRWREDGFIEVYHHQFQKNLPLHHGILDDAEEYDSRPLKRQLPTLIFHGLLDEVVPFQGSIDYLQEHTHCELVLFHSDHQLLDVTEKMWSYMKLFLEI